MARRGLQQHVLGDAPALDDAAQLAEGLELDLAHPLAGQLEGVGELLEGLHAQGRTILLITHDLSVAKRANRIVRLQDGMLKEAS